MNIHRRKCICKISFSLTTCGHLRWSIRPSPTANLTPALFISLDWLLRSWPQRVTYGAPGSPPSWPYAGPGRSSTQRSGRHLTGQKGERTMLAPHESNQAHREHIRTPGFYLPFLFLRVDWGVKFVRCLSCDRLTTSHTAFEIPKELHVAFSWFMLSVFIFSVRHWSVMFESDFWQEWTSLSTT